MIRLRNFSPAPFTGWIRTTTDRALPSPKMRVQGCDLVLGRRIGLDCHALDVHATLEPGQTLELNLDHADPYDGELAKVPEDIVGHFGGVPALNGVPLSLVGINPDGAGYRGHYRCRFGRMFALDLWLLWYPEMPALVQAEAMLTCSNADLPDMGDTLPALDLTFGDGRMIGALPKPGMRFADGQARCIPIAFLFARHLRGLADWLNAGALAHKAIGAVGVESLLWDGNPAMPKDFNLPAWAAEHWIPNMARLTTWDAPSLGPAKDTGQTGAVEDQTFVGGECFLPGGTGAELVNYYAALLTSGHPMHHLESDGTVVDRDRRPGLRMFYSRPHSTGTDRLNKGRDLTVVEAQGWNGPDAQHWTINRLAAAARTVDSPACQRLLEHHARNYLVQLTTTPGWATSAIWSAREIGWICLAVVHLGRCLEDRALASRVVAHWKEWVQNILLPHLAANPIWRTETGHPRLSLALGSPAPAWQLWMHAQAAYFLDVAGERFEMPAVRPYALAMGRLVLERGWTEENGRWVAYCEQLVDGSAKHRDKDFDNDWMPLAPAVVLRHDSTDAHAREVWQQIVAESGTGKWLPPETLLVR